MRRWFLGGWRVGIGMLTLWLGASGYSADPPKAAPPQLLLVVLDPLAKELACACVKGFGQRDYRQLAAHLQSLLKQRVAVEFSDDLAETVKIVGAGSEMVIVGDRSLVEHGVKVAGLKCMMLGDLTGLEGTTTMEAVFVARSADPASEPRHIAGRKVLLGVGDSDSKHAAAMEALHATLDDDGFKKLQMERRPSFSEAALDVLDSEAALPPVAVIPAYALRLLEGCGSIKPGSLKVIGRSKATPFISFSATDSNPAQREEIVKALESINGKPKLLKAMETRDGFKRAPTSAPSQPRSDWPDWRGPGRDGRVAKLPTRLPASLKPVWKQAAMPGGLAGLSVSDSRLMLAERDLGDEFDVYRCLNADTGALLWRREFPARGKLDYGQAPRATPVIHEGRVYLLGAFGDLRCLRLDNGKVVWQRNLPRDFKATLPTWGMCSTPLLLDGLVIVNPGASNASLAALAASTGRVKWTTPGAPAAYSSFISGQFGGLKQVIGYDQSSVGGWDPATGRRLWQWTPPNEGDFNVPTPVPVSGGVLLSTENNGTRVHTLDVRGRLAPKPAAMSGDLAPDASTPVVANGRVFGAHQGLWCLDAANGLKTIWHLQDNSLGDYTTLFADSDHVLAATGRGELLLLDARADRPVLLSRLKVFEGDVDMYSHPALAGTRLFARAGTSVLCVDLAAD